jgi:predicted NUDIX family NTP pyrophosphohydrolase
MGKRSAGVLMFRRRKDQLQVFLVHPGGPFWKNKDAGAWSIPKGEYGEKIHSMRRSESSKRKQESNPQGNSFPLIR